MAVIPKVTSAEFRFFNQAKPRYGADEWAGGADVHIDEMMFANITLMMADTAKPQWAEFYQQLQKMGVKMAWWTHIDAKGERRMKRRAIKENCTAADLAFIEGLRVLDRAYAAAAGFRVAIAAPDK